MGLWLYLKKAKNNEFFPIQDFDFDCQESLKIDSERLLELLEKVYYDMGKEQYDTSLEKNHNHYFIKKEEGIYEPNKMSTITTYGTARLINDDPQPKAGRKGQAPALKDLYETDKNFAEFICNYYLKNGKTLKHFTLKDNKIFLNKLNSKGKPKENSTGVSKGYIGDKYTKIPDFGNFGFEINEKYLSSGSLYCPFLNEGFKALLNNKNSLPFLRNIKSFTSFSVDQESVYKISLKALYLLRFCPAKSLYYYNDKAKKHSLHSFFFSSNSLKNDINIHTYLREFTLTEKEELKQASYMRNFRLYTFRSKGNFCIYKHKYELLFMLIYTFYTRVIDKINNYEVGDNPLFKLIGNVQLQANYPIKIVHIKSEGDSKTVRPKSQEEYSQVHRLIEITSELEKNDIKFKNILKDLLYVKPELTGNKVIEEERKIRNEVFKKFLRFESFLPEMVDLFFKCYSDKKTKYRNYWMLEKFTSEYEKIINSNNNMEQKKTIEEKAILAGYFIAEGILKFEAKNTKDRQKNAKAAKKYLIQLRKANDFEQFSIALERIMFKYNVWLDKSVQLELDDDKEQFIRIKHHILLKALSTLNQELNPSKNETK